MKLNSISFALVCLLFSRTNAVNAQNQQSLDADNQHITVFLDKAQIEAKVKANIKEGQNRLIIGNIAQSTIANSIQVGAKGDLIILGVKFRENHLANKKRNLLEDSLKNTKNELEVLEVLIKVADNERNMLMANANIKNEKEGLAPEELKEMMDFFRTKLTEIGTRQMQLVRQANDLKAKVEKYQSQLTEQGSSLSRPAGEIELLLSSKTNQTSEINLTYIATGAAWSPSYDIRAKNVRSNIDLAYKAQIFQNTGIDWKNVKLTLSTSNPSEGGDKPTLETSKLSIYEPLPEQKPSNRNLKFAAPMAMADAAMATQEITFAVETIQTTLAVNFDITIPYTVISGNNSTIVDIQSHSLPSIFNYYSVPKFDKDAFLVAKIVDWEKYNLLPGMANIYFEGLFVGNTQIGNADTKDTMQISLGRDKKIIAKKEEIKDYKSNKTIGSNIKEEFGYKISIRNTKSENVSLVLEEQIPVSQDSRIEVELEEAKGADFNKETGKLTWNLNLAASEEKELIIKYNVKYPKGKNIQGLN